MSQSKELPAVFSKGYGVISKSIMTDSSMSVESKTIFAYFCALAGSGNKTFPFRSTILKQLGISKNTYYKHYNMLIERNLISVIKASCLLSPNTYQINATQKDKKGYGIVARTVMQDNRLSLKAKGLYAYICSLSGKNNHSFPSKRQTLKQLSLSEPTYYKCLNQLKECGYVFTQQRKVLGRFSINDYYLYSLPKAVTSPAPDAKSNKKQNAKNWDTKNGDNTSRDIYLITNSSNNIVSNNYLSNLDKTELDMMNNSNNDSLRTFTVNLLNRFFPDSPHNKIITEFLPRFRDNIKKRNNIDNLTAYMKSSIKTFLEETSIKASLREKQSYDLVDFEELLNKVTL